MYNQLFIKFNTGEKEYGLFLVVSKLIFALFKVNPTPELLSQLRGQLCAMLISMHLAWAEELGIKSRHQALWIYSILGVLEKPISSDIARLSLIYSFFPFSMSDKNYFPVIFDP